MSKINIYKLVVLALLALMLVGFNNCVPEVPEQKGNSMRLPSSTSVPTPPKTEASVLVSLQLSTGVKNFEQILYTMSTVTGVPVTNSSIRNAYRQVEESLPSENNAKTFMASHQVAITKLAAEFCHVLVDNSTLRSQIWPGFNFGSTIRNGAFSSENREFLVLSAIDAFWIIASDEEKAEALEELHPLFDDLMAGESEGNSSVTRNVVKGICTAVLSSTQVTLL